LHTFRVVHLATQVEREIRQHVPFEELEIKAGCTVEIHAVPQSALESRRAELPPELSLQEADLATLALALQLAPDLVLTDDLAVRRAVEVQQQIPMGSVGVLLRAYKAGCLDSHSLEQAIDRLFVHSTLYLSPLFKSYVQRIITEMIDR
jgi:predicted nucleic acid-binding protein